MNETVWVDNQDISAIENFRVVKRDHFTVVRNNKLQNLTSDDGAKHTFSKNEAKKIIVEGVFSARGRENLDARVDELLEIVNQQELVPLRMTHNNVEREWQVILNSWITSELKGGLTSIILEFLAPDPFGKALTSSQLLSQAITTATSSNAINIAGTAPRQFLTITIDITSLTASAINTITIGNGTTGTEIAVTETFSASDQIIIDVENKTVNLNGTEVDYTGQFPYFAPNVHNITYEDDLSARNVTLTVDQTPRYT